MRIPDHIREHIISTHAEGVPVIERTGFTPERIEIALAIEKHRWFWKPEKVRLVLIGESHVYTAEDDFRQRLDVSRIASFLECTPFVPGHDQPEPIPEYVGLVYCLGYGEKSLRLDDICESSLQSTESRKLSDKGTPQFWNMVFGLLTGTYPPHTGVDRITWKIQTLVEMYRRGIWLLDASVHAIYHGTKNRIGEDCCIQLHKQWWDGYGKHILKPGDQAQVWVIGKGVYDALSESCPDFTRICSGWIYQPNAYITNDKRKEVLLPLVSYAHSLPDSNLPGKADVVCR